MRGRVIPSAQKRGTVFAPPPLMTPWGWQGSKPYRDAVKRMKTINTKEGTIDIQEINGKVPTEEEARRLIEDAGGTVKRVEEHGADSVSGHKYWHINYDTADGIKGTIRIQK